MPNLINVSDFALASTVECGQAFRWSRTADCWFEGVVGRRVIRLRQHLTSVEWESRPQAEKKVRPRVEFEEGEQVRVVTGPFADFNGAISEIDIDRSKLKVLVNIFDRETPVELAFDQVAKA